MKKEVIESLIKSGVLRVRQLDTERIKSMIKSSEVNATVAKNIPLDENSATLVFREIYESIRQLGDARWWCLGYEPLSHDASMDILKEIDVKEKLKLNHLTRFKRMRNDANYRGFRISVTQAQEIIDFWNSLGKEIIHVIKDDVSRK